VKAAVLIDPHNMVIEDVPEPIAGNGEVVLKVAGCGISNYNFTYFSMMAPIILSISESSRISMVRSAY
jgi:threonine dehydrogenase-like Zn-dependent dehydrogenase